MLPFLKKSQEASMSAPIETVERDPDEETPFDSMDSAAEDLCNAIETKDYKAVSIALRAAFELMGDSDA